jgi:16S rRNA (guanine(527)-N(7))-methyltransferase RsmG
MDPHRIAELLAPFFNESARRARSRMGRPPLEPDVSPGQASEEDSESLQGRHPLTPNAEPVEPVVLSPRQLDQISIYIDLLLRWNARINLTAIRDPEQIVTRHFGESLFAARHLVPCGAGTLARVEPHLATEGPSKTGATAVPPVEGRAVVRPGQPNDSQTTCQDAGQSVTPAEPNSTRSRSVVDLGSGAGFPGLPIKIWSPHTSVTLIESNQKKVAFLREVIRALTLTDIDVFPRRAEDYPAASALLLTLRAVERFEAILPAAARLLFPGGTLALLIGQSQVAQAQTLLPAFSWHEPFPIPLSSSRLLVRATPNQRSEQEPR